MLWWWWWLGEGAATGWGGWWIIIIIIIKRISRAPIYHTRWQHRALNGCHKSAHSKVWKSE